MEMYLVLSLFAIIDVPNAPAVHREDWGISTGVPVGGRGLVLFASALQQGHLCVWEHKLPLTFSCLSCTVSKR
jgi:hypothetical protein